MTNVWIIARRELSSYFTTLIGYVVAAAMLFIAGLLFNVFAIGGQEKFSEEILKQFFYFMSGMVMVGSMFLSMRLLAREHGSGTMVVLYTSPVAEWQIVLGKFVSALIFLGLIIVVSLYMPLLIFANGKISVGHVFAGSLGLMLLGAACVAIGTFASSLSRYQIVSLAVAALIILLMLLMWMLGKVVGAPLDDIFGSMALFDKHFQPFMKGVINLRDVVFYLSVTFFFLLAATKILQARRWR